jgi:hypothetical protein
MSAGYLGQEVLHIAFGNTPFLESDHGRITIHEYHQVKVDRQFWSSTSIIHQTFG